MLGSAIPGQHILAQPTTDGAVPTPTPPADGGTGEGWGHWIPRWGKAFMWHRWHKQSGS